ncbi:MAG: endolytic transglycosylase MltG [candidate division Zixibacteria bacterium]|nr:endolytic transglycosylase MltG [candidate division Zixibacteria bacterium]
MFKAIVIAVLLLALVLAAYGLVAYTLPVDLGSRTVSVIIKPGDPFSMVADSLAASGVARSAVVMRYAAQWWGVDTKLIPGRYDFTGKNSGRSILDKFERGDIVTIRVTIYEGAQIWKVASILASRMEADSAEIVRLNTNSEFIAELGVPCLEGYLFPETYFFPWGTGTKEMLRSMVAMFHAKTDTLLSGVMLGNLSRGEVVILASIVEAEALLNDEKPLIASVYRNRIRDRMKLDADPTVIYGLGGLNHPLNRRDLEAPTSYNTYLRRGLPPTPIGSPGLAALRAVLYPAETDYFFFVADGTGKHRFSRTNDEHNRTRREIRRSLRNKS